jgi:predicted ArsR family transcriptional regulator
MSELREIEDEMRRHPDPVVTVPELADRLDRSTTAIRNDLKLLERDGAVGSKQTGSRAVAWWHEDRVAPRHVAPDEHPDQTDLEDQVERVDGEQQTPETAVELLDLPGDGEVLESREDAMRALLRHLRDGGDTTAGELRELTYEHHETHYKSARSWWKNYAGDALSQLRDHGVVKLVDKPEGIWSWRRARS